MSTTQQPEALRLANEFKLCNEYDSIPSINDIAKAEAELYRLHTENTALQQGYAAARLEIESLQARIKTMAEEHADELMVAHLDGRMRGRGAEPADEYPALPKPFCSAHDDADSEWPDMFSADQMRAYADATCAIRAAQPAGAQQPVPSVAVASKAVLAAIRAANMQLVRTGDDEFMLVTLKQATPQANSVLEDAARWNTGACAQWKKSHAAFAKASVLT